MHTLVGRINAPVVSPLRLKNHDRHPLFRSVSYRNCNVSDAQSIRDLCGNSVELQRRPSRCEICDFKVLPADAVPPSGAKCFHRCFLGRKAGRVALITIRLALNVSNFGGCVNAIDKALPVAFDGVTNPMDFRQIDAETDDHNSAPVDVMVKRPCLTPLVLIKASAIFFTVLARPLTTSTSRQLS
jgi:hypothetical protein